MRWNRHDTKIYHVDIGDVSVVIHSHLRSLHLVHYPCVASPKRNVNVWFDRDVSLASKECFQKAMRCGERFLPESIRFAYHYLRVEDKMPYHMNRYVKLADSVYVHYAYPTDDFFAAFELGSREIYLWGDEIALERLLISFLSVTGDCFPYHAACVSRDSKGYMLIGDSNSGKTGLTLALLNEGAGYIADDILYVDDQANGYRCSGHLAVRQNFLPSHFRHFVVANRGGRSFVNVCDMLSQKIVKVSDTAPICKIFLLSPLRQSGITCEKLYCAFKHDSIFTAEVLGESCEYIGDIIRESMKAWDKLRNEVQVVEMEIDHNNFSESVDRARNAILI